MKKSLFIIACAAATMTMSAQQNVVKEAEKAMKAGKNYTEVLAIITPAMTNPETSTNSTTFFIPGMAGFNQYDKMFGMQQLGRLNPEDESVMAAALMGGYENFIKALPLDTVVDAKGKVKTNHSKKIKDVIKGHYNDFTQAGINLYNAKNYQGAYDAWLTFVDLSDNADKYDITPQPDSVVANFLMNGGLAAWQLGDNALASKTFRKAAEKGYDKETLWQYGLATAIAADAPEELTFFATTGNERYGDHDTQYINSLINNYLKQEKYDEAIRYLDEAIAKEPTSSQYYALEGIIYESKDDMPKAMELYQKAVDLDSKNGLANYYYGRGLSIEAGTMADNFNGNDAEYQKYYRTELLPRYQKAIKVLEDAYEQDPNNRSNTLNMLEQLYYVTNDEAGMNSVKDRKLGD